MTRRNVDILEDSLSKEVLFESGGKAFSMDNVVSMDLETSSLCNSGGLFLVHAVRWQVGWKEGEEGEE